MGSSNGRSCRRRDKYRLAYPTQLRHERGLEMSGKWVMSICGGVEKIEFETTARERLKGMLFADPDDITRLLVPCKDIHTFGMSDPIDIAFISKDGSVLEVHRNLGSRRRLRRREASMVAERFSREGEWLKAGDKIRLGVPEEE